MSTLFPDTLSVEPRHPHKSHNELLRLIVERVKSGALPDHVPERVLGGISGPETCTLCGEELAAGELRLYASGSTALKGEIRLHPTCFHVWCSSMEGAPP
jgi:hypothetical protein